MKVYGQLERAQIEAVGALPTVGVRGRIVFLTTDSLYYIDDGSVWHSYVSVDQAQTLSLKTLTAPTINDGVFNIESLTDQGATPSSPSAGTTKFYSKTDGKLYKLTSAGVEQEVGAGAGGGSINYISANPDAETATTGWTTYADAAGATPVDGTGGASTLTFTRTTSGPLRGTGSFLVTTTAANLQGNGASYDFTLSVADQAKILSISFDYSVASGTYVSGDMAVYIYDVTNSTVIQPAGYQIQALGSTLPNKHIATFQTSATGTSYRLIFHRAVATASAMTMKIDNVQVGPQVVQYGAPVTDWQSYTPTITNGGTTSSNAGFWRRVGDSMQVQLRTVFTGAGSGVVGYSIPSGFTIDTAKIPNFTQYRNQLGGGTWLDSGTDFNPLSVIYNTTTTVAFANEGAAAEFNGTQLASGDNIYAEFMAPIAGWSSTVQMSNDTDTRLLAVSVNATPTSATFSDNANWIFSAVAQDTHGAYNTTTGTFTAPMPGTYSFSGQAGITGSSAGTSFELYIKKNGTTQKTFNPSSLVTGEQFISFNCDLVLVAGDAITFRFLTDKTSPAVSGGATKNSLNIRRLSGPSAIAATETVAASYSASAATAIQNGTATVVDFATKIFDTHNAVTTGASWKFTAPVSGRYLVAATVESATGGGWAAGEFWSILATVTATGFSTQLHRNFSSAAHTSAMGAAGSTLVNLLAGQTIDIRVAQNSGASLNTANGADQVHVDIVRVGN